MDGDFSIRRSPTPSSTLAFGRLHSLSPGILSWAKEAYLLRVLVTVWNSSEGPRIK